MEQVIVVEGSRSCGMKDPSCQRVQYGTPVSTRTYAKQVEEPECCLPMEIHVPLKKTCLCFSQTPVFLFIILLSLVYIISIVQCWCACSCDNGGKCKSKDGEQCDTDSTAKWTAFAINTLVYVLLAIVISMWLYRLSQYKQTTLLAVVMSVAVPIFCWWFFWYINQIMFYQQSNGKC
jgi:hypothetical protein